MTASSDLETPSTTCASNGSASQEAAASLASVVSLSSVVSKAQVEAQVEPTARADKVLSKSAERFCGAASATNNANDQKPSEKLMTKSASDRNYNTKEAARLQTAGGGGDTEDETDHGNRVAKCEATKARDLTVTPPPPAQLGGGQSKFRRNINNLNSLNYATNQQQQQQIPYDQQLLSISLPAAIQFQQNFVQPTPANIYNQPLVSWSCPMTAAGSGGPLREGPPPPPQLYGMPLLYHHPQLTCASSYHPHLQSALMAANFAHAPLGHVPNYLPPPAVYTGHHLYNHNHHHHHHLHPDQLLLAPPPPPPPLVSPVASPLQTQAAHQLNQSRPSSPSASVSSVDTAGETSRVIVDCGEPPKSFASVTTKRVATQETGQRNKGETRAQDAAAAAELVTTTKHFSEPTPRNDNDQSPSDKHNTATLCDDEKAFARCSNRSSSQQRQNRATAPANDDDGGGNLIRCDDNESKNDICRTTKHRQQRPLNEPRPRVIQCEAQIRGETKADEQVDRPSRQQQQQSRSDQLLEATNTTARAQSDTSTQTRPGPTSLTDQQQNHCNQWKELRPDREPDRQDRDLMVAAGGNSTDSSSTVVTSNNNNVNKSNSCLGGLRECRRADDSDSDAEAPFRVGAETQLNEHKVERQDDEEQTTTTTTTTRNRIKTKSDDETTTKPVAELNPISINGTTFYHVNPAALIRPLATTIDGQAGHQFAPGYNYNVGATYQPMGGLAPNLMGYFQPHYQLVNDYLNQPQPPPPGSRLVDHHLYYWPNTRQPPTAVAAAVPFELVQPTAFGLATGQRLEHPQHYGQLAGNLEQRPLLTYHHQVAATCPRPHDQHFSYLPSAIGNATQPTFEPHQAPTGTPSSQTVSQQQTAALQQQPPPTAPTAAAAAGVTSNSTGVSQLKLGYNLIPLLPINAIPTRVRQAYGMDKVWQDEFEQLFSQFVSQVVWTLVEVETNPNIRSSSRILAYKSRYIVRVDNGPVTTTTTTTSSPDKNSADESGSISSAPGAASPHAASEATGDDGVEDDEDDANSSWNGPEEDEQNCCCGSSSSATDAEERDQQQTSSETDESRRRSGGIRQGPRSGSSTNGGESDCDSGAALNSTSGFSETTSQDLSSPNELAGPNQQSPANSPPCLDSDETNVANSGVGGTVGNVTDCSAHNGRRFPLKFRMFIDSAKVRFCCDTCGHGWTSMKGRVVFWYELFELVDGPSRSNAAASEGVSNLIGYCAYKLFGQQCDICKIENRFERPMWYPEEVTKVLCNLFNKIGQVYFGFRMPNIDKQRRAGKPKTSHNSLLCQACHDGVCTDRK